MNDRTHLPDTPEPDRGDERLPCGRLLSQVWGDWEDGSADEHARTCPHCLQATADLEDLESAVRGLHGDAPAAGGPEVDAAALTQRVMDVVRLELRPGRPLPLGAAGEDLWITESVAARTLRSAAERVSGVRAGSCRIAPDEGGAAGAADRAAGAAERVTVRLAIHAPLDAPDLTALAERVRGAVVEAADRRLGLDVAAVDIRITDLVERPGGAGDEGGAGL